uniref:NADH-ubiquinone oxidoreductase chain 2 n=1 Tax=Haemaphysalis cornigera TaxID=1325867 RepID=A0A976MYZ0_9ACAR|nr:NADH dehydrogenase subunit 2 [Haemaphysalis cornigera]YP_011004250.1 NADH dehydrogenase subunit 2 [Haemaphysalis taiwana]UNO53897.1 NADH dehydrogenase subunit 2 [Haemaphysalis cornigera]UNO53910.1 NADH dehydrogenase subunit 2 [Haemaphysalis cornigera]WPS93612.1 NADH dehydrogenase subunit 2 [Haemaphysalis taiwana]
MFYKKLMKWMIMLTIIISISSNNWFIFWIMMEMNMLVFIPILKQNKMENCNSMISYFIIQSFSSIMFFMGSSMMMMNQLIINEMLINISLMIKLAMIPFHSWLILISETLDYNSFIIIITIQKVIPLFILDKMKSGITFLISIMSIICSSIMIYNLKLFKKILIFSSISHLSWMIIVMYSASNFWMFYMIIYYMMIYMILKIMKKNNIISINSLIKIKMNNDDKISMIILLMSLGGMPPFIGFVIKFLAISIIIKYSYITMIILILSSLINIFIYIRMIMPILIMFNKMNKNLNFLKIMKNFMVSMIIIVTFIVINMIL